MAAVGGIGAEIGAERGEADVRIERRAGGIDVARRRLDAPAVGDQVRPPRDQRQAGVRGQGAARGRQRPRRERPEFRHRDAHQRGELGLAQPCLAFEPGQLLAGGGQLRAGIVEAGRIVHAGADPRLDDGQVGGGKIAITPRDVQHRRVGLPGVVTGSQVVLQRGRRRRALGLAGAGLADGGRERGTQLAEGVQIPAGQGAAAEAVAPAGRQQAAAQAAEFVVGGLAGGAGQCAGRHRGTGHVRMRIAVGALQHGLHLRIELRTGLLDHGLRLPIARLGLGQGGRAGHRAIHQAIQLRVAERLPPRLRRPAGASAGQSGERHLLARGECGRPRRRRPAAGQHEQTGEREPAA